MFAAFFMRMPTCIYNVCTARGLEPGSLYNYQVGLDGGATSSLFTFRTAPPADASEQPFTMLVVGDMGLNNSAATMRALAKRSQTANMTLHAGDIGYGCSFACLHALYYHFSCIHNTFGFFLFLCCAALPKPRPIL